MEKSIVCKFGGTSLADVDQIRKATNIICGDPARRHIVVSAPGKRHKDDIKVTDLFYNWKDDPSGPARGLITERFIEIVTGLKVDIDIERELEVIASLINTEHRDFAASRGEYLMAKIMAKAVGFGFVDAKDCIVFNKGLCHTDDIFKSLTDKSFVMPGFYGWSVDERRVQAFSRGGSDISGAMVAMAVRAKLYENWTDVSGILRADPRIVDNPKPIESMTYHELRELAGAGANVFHSEAVFPVQDGGIPTRIANTNRPGDLGTYILSERKNTQGHVITGIAGRTGFTIITVTKRLMHSEKGFVAEVLLILKENEVGFEHMPTGIDSLSLVVESSQLEGKISAIRGRIIKNLYAGSVLVDEDIALIAVVGKNMIHRVGIAAEVFSALKQANVNVRAISQGSNEMTIVIAVATSDYEKATRALYEIKHA